MALAFTVSAYAEASRTFVSTTGNDSNIDVNCSASASCRTFAAALSVTTTGGEIVVLDSGGYGRATIIRSVVIAAIGIDASISTTISNANGLAIDTPGNVTIIGLSLHGEATGADGIVVGEVGFLRLYNMLIENFKNCGVDFTVAGNLAIYNSVINDNGNAGLQLANASAVAFVQGTSFEHNFNGVDAGPGQATIVDSSAESNTNYAFGTQASGGIVTLVNDSVMSNVTGLVATSGGTLYFVNSSITGNNVAYDATGGTMAGSNPGTSFIAPGQGVSGTLSTAIALQ